MSNNNKNKLFVAHNLTEDKLRHAHLIGGLAAPSLAVIGSETGFFNFGEITLVGNPDLANPRKNGVRIFNADVYSPRHPKIQWDLRKREFAELEERLEPAAELLGRAVHIYISPEKFGREGLDLLKNEDIAKMTFLMEIGDAPRLRLKPAIEVDKRLKKFKGTTREIMAADGFEQVVHEILDEIVANARDEWKERITSRSFETRDGVIRVQHNELASYAKRLVRSRDPRDVDSYEMSKAIRQKLEKSKKRMAEFDIWLEANFGPALGRPFFRTEAGRKKDYELDLIVREMVRSVRDAEGWDYGAGSVRSLVAHQFSSLTDVKENRDKIMTEADFEEHKRKTDDWLVALADKFAPYHGSSKDYGWLSVFTECLKALARGEMRHLREEAFSPDLPEELLDEAKDFLRHMKAMPSEYFEVKMRRAVHLEEFEAAMVPKDASKGVLNILKECGLKIIRYGETHDDVARQAAYDDLPEKVFFERNVEGFYSELYRGVEEAKQKSARAEDWKHIIRKMPGVKQDEIEWTMIDEWLDLHAVQQVLRADVLAYLETQKIDMVETSLGGVNPKHVEYLDEIGEPLPPEDGELEDLIEKCRGDAIKQILDERPDKNESDLSEQLIEEFATSLAIGRYYERDLYTRSKIKLSNNYDSVDAPVYEGIYDHENRTVLIDHPDFPAGAGYGMPLEEAIELANSLARQEFPLLDGETKHESYTIDGGENYREIQIRIPNLHNSGPNKADVPPELQADWDKTNKIINDAEKAGNVTFDQIKPFLDKRTELSALIWPKAPFVQDSHFQEENIVVHARVKDRVDLDGNRILFVEEVQSDLTTYHKDNTGQNPVDAASRRNVETELRVQKKKSYDKRNEVLELVTPEFLDRFGPKAEMRAGEISDLVFLKAFEFAEGKDIISQSEDIMEQAIWLGNRITGDDVLHIYLEHVEATRKAQMVRRQLMNMGTDRGRSTTVPDTPFKDKAAVNFMVKYLTKLAAEEGYDKLSVTQGFSQAARWGRAGDEVFRTLEWKYDQLGNHVVDITMGDREVLTVRVNENGVINLASRKSYQGKSLASLIGPKLTKEILTEESGKRKFSRRSFSSTGFGMVYDQQIPSALNKLGKRHDTKVYADTMLPDFGAKIMTDSQLAQELPYEEVRSAAVKHFGEAFVEEIETYEVRATEARIEGITFNIPSYEKEIADLRALPTNEKNAQRISDTEQLIADKKKRAQKQRDDLKANQALRLMAQFTEETSKEYFSHIDRRLPSSDAAWSIDINEGLRAAVQAPMPIFERSIAPYPPLKQEALDKIEPELNGRLKALGISDVRLTSDASFREAGATQIYRSGAIEVIVGQSLDPRGTVDHEAIHVLRNRGLFTDAEWDTLSAQAERDWLHRYNIASRYPDYSRQTQVEEAIAHAFVDYRRRPAPNGLISSAFEKVRKVFKAVTNTLSGNAFRTAEDVFDTVSSGRVGKRYRPRYDNLPADEVAGLLYLRNGSTGHDHFDRFIAEAQTSGSRNEAGSSVIYSYGNQELRIWKDGSIQFKKDGKLHAEDGPALIKPNGDEVWLSEGKPVKNSADEKLSGPTL